MVRRALGALLTLRAATDNDLNRKYEDAGDSDQYLQQQARLATSVRVLLSDSRTRSQVLLPLGALTHVEVQWTVKLAEYAGQRPSNCTRACLRARLCRALTLRGSFAVMDALSVAQHSLVSKAQSISAK